MMRWAARTLLSCAAALLLAGAAYAQEATRARLITVPDAQILSDHFPPVALANAVSGRVVLSCAIAVDGSSECSTAEETPAAMGFGGAAEALARDWRFEPRTEDGQPVASVSRIPIEFQNAIERPVTIERDIYVVPTNPPPPPNDSGLSDDGIVVSACRIPGNRRCLTERVVTGTPVQTEGYPAQAETARTPGHALLACAVRSNGSTECAIEREAPANTGFGLAALSVIGRLDTNSSYAPGSVYRVPVRFTFRDADGRIEQVSRISMPERRGDAPPYPDAALATGRDGEALLECAIESSHALTCTVASQTPQNGGFGRAALRLVEGARVRDETIGLPGYNIGDRFHVVVIFRADR